MNMSGLSASSSAGGMAGMAGCSGSHQHGNSQWYLSWKWKVY